MNAEGLGFNFLIGDPVARSWYEGIWFSHEIRFIRDQIIKPGDVVFDCGAHHGCTTILFSKWVGSEGRVVAFEPFPSNAAILARNIELNQLTNVALEQKVLGAQRGRASISAESDAHVISQARVGIELPMVPLDDYVDQRPTFLKIDVEGFEVDVVRGAQEVLRLLPKLAIEIHGDALSRYGTSADELKSLLHLEWYNVWIQWNFENEPQPYRNERINGQVHLFAIPTREGTA
jgi:FkbM family methyltransferase